ncbi:restriction endonuclease [Paenibacillaceae bacterium WGS1546]|uniref:restriction endonuclease n=1 Tax=Cohnella sp. WGS1546 TaxID=3366810 RepID=UPI00372D4746
MRLEALQFESVDIIPPAFKWFLIGIIVLGVIAGILQPAKKQRKRKRKRKPTANKSVSKASEVPNQRKSNACRPDEVILSLPLNQLGWAEFERLLALYFRDNGYVVHEVGVGGKDGGVDLVIIDKRGEKTAVQAKCYSERNNVGTSVIRELSTAKRNHDCILSLLVTASDLTVEARKEADQFRVDYWHGALLEDKLRRWGKWSPGKKRRA